MPTRTWSNLDPARRDRVLAAARIEFGRNGYSRGSLNVIAREAGVAKGSLFQYFTDKFDFYAYVAEHCGRTVHHDLGHLLVRPPGTPLADHLADALYGWVSYFADHPVERGLTIATNLELDPDARTAIRGPIHRLYVEALRPMFAQAVNDGELPGDTDLDALVAMAVLLLQHLAMAPFTPGIDPVLGLYGQTPDQLRPAIRRLVGTLLHHIPG
ncbi:MAG: TetR/AcrR family transcriptional regulator [Micromonosporaceae bacterium]